MKRNKYIYVLATIARKLGFRFHEERDERVIRMRREINKIGKIEFSIEQYPDGSWTAESVNIDGIMTGGIHSRNITATLKDAIFTYFEIPPHLCTDALLRGDNEPVMLKQHVYV